MNSQGLWISGSCDVGVTAIDPPSRSTTTPFANVDPALTARDEVGGIGGTPAVPCRLDEL
jgi:hypothetical protein